MALQLNLTKPGDAPQGSLKLNLAKGARFTVEAFWSDGADLDAHAFLLREGKVTGTADILSYATSTAGRGKPFATPCGSLSHSGDARTGVGSDVDEIITIDSGKLPSGVNEVAVFLTVYDANKKFGDVAHAGIRIKDGSGKVIEEIHLSQGAFAAFNVVQLGSIVDGPTGFEFSLAGTGIVGDLNTVLSHLS